MKSYDFIVIHALAKKYKIREEKPNFESTRQIPWLYRLFYIAFEWNLHRGINTIDSFGRQSYHFENMSFVEYWAVSYNSTIAFWC